MSAAPPQRMAQQPAASAAVSMDALDHLQGMINLVLVQSGHFLREQQSGGGSGRYQYLMKKAVPSASDRFQGSLDELEGGIKHAQAVLRRDLALLQADRVKRVQAETAERQRVAEASSAQKLENTPPTEDSTAPVDEPAPVVPKKEHSPDAPPAPASPQAEQPPPDVSTTPAPPADPLFDDAPATADAQDSAIDFDAIFGPGSGADEAVKHDADNQGEIKMENATAEDLHFDLDDNGPSLLRGLEDFAKGGDDVPPEQPNTDLDMDFTMPDLPDLPPTSQPTNPPNTIKTEETPKPQPPTDSAPNGDVDEAMATDNFDDLFNMDYENPETTEFDNAFFGFDEG